MAIIPLLHNRDDHFSRVLLPCLQPCSSLCCQLIYYFPILVFLVAQMVKNLSAVQETWVLSLSQEDPLEKGMATHFSILAWEIPWTEEPSGVQSMESQRVGHDWVTNMFTLSVLANFFFFFLFFFFLTLFRLLSTSLS